MGNITDKIAGAANQAAGKAKEGVGKVTGSKELEAEGLAQEAKGKAERLSGNVTPMAERTVNDHTISIVAAILILTVIVQVILVKSWT
jgi:uncharacterized protein YjbJ (UPF0337 family)